MTTARLPNDEADCASWECVYWAERLVVIADGRGRQPLPEPCPMQGLRQRVWEAREQLTQALALIDARCSVPVPLDLPDDTATGEDAVHSPVRAL